MFRPEFDGLEEVFDEAENTCARLVTEGMAEATLGLKKDLRTQALDAGLGQKVANTWRSKVFPQRGASFDPSGFVWSRAPGIADAFDRNPLIVTVNGRKFLAIPTENVPRSGRYNRRMAPAQVSKAYGQALTFVREKNGNVLVFVKQVAANTKKGFTTSKLALKKAGRKATLVLMFVLTPAVRVGKRMDIDSAAEYWGDRAADLINSRF